MALLAPSTAAADTCTYATDRPNHQGWVALVHPGCLPVRYGGTYDSFTAWRWNGTAWRGVTVTEAEVFYMWPFSPGWTWIWSQRTGWLAISSDQVLIRRTFVTCATCYEWWLDGPAY